MTYKSLILYIIVLLCLYGCNKTISKQAENGIEISLSYAKGFTVTAYPTYTEVVVRHPQDTNQIFAQYYLYDTDSLPVALLGLSHCLQVPLNNIACLSTTHIGFLSALNLEDKLVAMTGTQWVYSDKVRQKIQAGRVRELGQDGSLNKELLLTLQPDAVMGYLSGIAGYDEIEGLEELGLQVIINNEFLEMHPLGMAEWVRFVALFFDMQAEGDAYFQQLEQRYDSLKMMASLSSFIPEVLTGFPYKGEWTVSGGQSFAATYMHDAGGKYLWSENQGTGNFAVALEEVLLKAAEADVWINPGGATTIQAIQRQDSRLETVQPMKTGQIFNNNKRVNAAGGNDYWESAVVHPDWVLQDLIRIFHPSFPDRDSLIYYQQVH